MILDFGSFTRRGFLVNCVRTVETWEGGGGGTGEEGRIKHRNSRGCKDRKEAVEDGEATDLFVMVK